jgi:hypothetical protein
VTQLVNFVANTGDGMVEISASVPEPSSWALMLVGFAGLGYAGFRQTSKITLA